MKKVYFVGVVLIIALSCNKDNDAGYQLTSIHYLENMDLFNYVTCFSLGNIQAQSGFVIRDEQTYQLYADSMRIQPLNTECDTATLTAVDFTKNSLIGILTDHGACDSLSRDIAVDNEAKVIHYTIDIKESDSPCILMLILPLNLALIPKIPDNYRVEFNVNRHGF